MNNPKVLGGAAVAIGAILYFSPGNIFNSPGVQNVGDAWARGGGTQNGTPAISTPRGSKDDNSTPHEARGVGSKAFDEQYADQKKGMTSSVSKQWNQAMLGNDKGK